MLPEVAATNSMVEQDDLRTTNANYNNLLLVKQPTGDTRGKISSRNSYVKQCRRRWGRRPGFG